MHCAALQLHSMYGSHLKIGESYWSFLESEFFHASLKLNFISPESRNNTMDGQYGAIEPTRRNFN